MKDLLSVIVILGFAGYGVEQAGKKLATACKTAKESIDIIDEIEAKLLELQEELRYGKETA